MTDIPDFLNLIPPHLVKMIVSMGEFDDDDIWAVAPGVKIVVIPKRLLDEQQKFFLKKNGETLGTFTFRQLRNLSQSNLTRDPGGGMNPAVAEPAVTPGGAPGQAGIPALKDPPIEEVVCGFVFEPVAALDALEQGIYWQRVEDRYPGKQLQPAIIEGVGFFPGVAPLRSWLIASAEDFLLQVQADRFYVNWRRRGGAYPRFRDHDGAEGLCSRALKEFASFSEFVQQRLKATLKLKRIELQKLDLLTRPKHWTDLDDLGAVLPSARTFSQIRRTEHLGLNLRVVDKDELGSTTTLHIVTRMDPDHRPNAVQLDFQGTSLLGADDDPVDAFHVANDRLNSLFGGLIAESAWVRFGGPP